MHSCNITECFHASQKWGELGDCFFLPVNLMVMENVRSVWLILVVYNFHMTVIKYVLGGIYYDATKRRLKHLALLC